MVGRSHPLSSTFKKLYIKEKLSISIALHSSPRVSFRHLSDVYKVLALSFKRFSVGQFLRMLSDVSFLNSRPLMLPVVQFSFAIFYPAIFHTLCLFSAYHTFIFQQTILASCLWCFFVHSSTACLLSAPPWVNSSVIILVLPLISVSCFVLFQTQSLNVFPFT